MPKVSVIVPVYNVEEYVERCIESLINQTLSDIEIIIVNDGSTDKSKEKIMPYVQKFSDKVKYLEKENGGLSSARNFGMPYATGEYIAFLDSDDYVKSQMYETMYNKAKEENSDMVECDFIWKYTNKEKEDIGVIYKNKKEMIVKARVVAWNKLIKRDVIEKANIKFPEGLRYEDVEFFYKLVPYLNKVSFVKQSFIYYVQRSNSIANTQNSRTKEIFTILDDVLNYYKENNLYDEYKEQLEYIYARYLLCSSLKRMVRIQDKTERSEALRETEENLRLNFPKWGENTIIKQEKSLKNLYLRLMYNVKLKKDELVNKVQKWLAIFIIICPLLDMMSFIFRNKFNTNLSPTTFLRPLIPTIILIYYFFKEKNKKKIFFTGMGYGIYGIIHLYLFKVLQNSISYGNIIGELQYIINYSFMIVTLYVFLHTFKNKNTDIIRKSVLISLMLYIVSIYIAILTGTSSNTYIEGTGFKGWFESGNSLCAVLLLEICIVIPYLKDNRMRIWTLITVLLTGIYLMFLAGTRTGLFGFILIVGIYVISEILNSIIHKVKINKKAVIVILSVMIIGIIVVILFGSQTLKRRKELAQNEVNNLDSQTGEKRYVSGDVLDLYKKIKNNEILESDIPLNVQNAIVRMCDFAERTNMSNVNSREQQLVYNFYLVLEQCNPILILFGNGYKTQFRELVMEMELPSILFNFGILGLLLYIMSFILIWCLSIRNLIRNRKDFNIFYFMSFIGLSLGLALSTLAGYTFFNCSSMICMVLLTNELKNNNIKKDC